MDPLNTLHYDEELTKKRLIRLSSECLTADKNVKEFEKSVREERALGVDLRADLQEQGREIRHIESGGAFQCGKFYRVDECVCSLTTTHAFAIPRHPSYIPLSDADLPADQLRQGSPQGDRSTHGHRASPRSLETLHVQSRARECQGRDRGEQSQRRSITDRDEEEAGGRY